MPAGEEEDEFPDDKEPSEESRSHLGMCVYDAMSVIAETPRDRRMMKTRDKTIKNRTHVKRATFGEESIYRFLCDTITECYDYRPVRKRPPRPFKITTQCLRKCAQQTEMMLIIAKVLADQVARCNVCAVATDTR